MACIDEIRKDGCYGCADKVDAEDGYCQTYKAYHQALKDLCNKLCSNDTIADFMKDYIREKAEELMK